MRGSLDSKVMFERYDKRWLLLTCEPGQVLSVTQGVRRPVLLTMRSSADCKYNPASLIIAALEAIYGVVSAIR